MAERYSMQKQPQNTIGYVTAPQANIYLDGILIDECYDIQYHYREAKEPIYGYLDQHFNTIVKGTVLITGSLTINYKHDQYLSAALQKAQNPVLPRHERNKRPQQFKDSQKEYRAALIQYSEKLKLQAALKKELALAIKERDETLYALQKKKEAISDNLSKKEMAVAEHIASLNVPDPFEQNEVLERWYKKYQDEWVPARGELLAKIAAVQGQIKDLQGDGVIIEQARESLQTQLDSLEAEKAKSDPLDPYPRIIGFKDYLALRKEESRARSDQALADSGNLSEQADLEMAEEEVKGIEAELKRIDLDSERKNISNLKAVMDRFTVTDVNLAQTLEKSLSGDYLNSTRAENFRSGFTIEFTYNGMTHKRIIGCELVGHSHVITQSGMPVKEQYTFIGRKLE